MRSLVEIYRYRELLKNLVVNELKLRYRRSVLGFLWTMLNPLLMMTVLAVVFSFIMKFNIKAYAVMLISGLLPWVFFSQAVSLALGSVVGKGSLLKKVYIPKTLLPLSAVLSSMINFLLALAPLFLLVVIMGKPLTPALLFLPVSIIFVVLFACGVGMIFACLNVFFRDFTHMTEVIIQAWFYLSPVIYRVEMVPERYRPIFRWNPMAHIIECFRIPIFDGQLPDMITAVTAGTSGLFMCVLGFAIFLRFERHFILHV